MGQIVIFSDLHAHPFKPYATILPGGMNSRLHDAVKCIDQIFEYCVANDDVEAVLFGGDLFHVRRTINVQAFNAVYEAIAKFRLRGIPVVLIHGNHDQADRLGDEHSVHAFRTFCTVIDRPGWVRIDCRSRSPKTQQILVLGVPYTENIEQLRNVVKEPAPDRGSVVPKIFLGHFGVQGAAVGSDFVYTNPHDAAVDDLNQAAFDAGFLGHYHLHQRVGANFWYVGAPLQHNWGDVDQWRGFLSYDLGTRGVTKHALQSPRFIKVDTATLDGMDASAAVDLCKDNFVRIVDERTWSEEVRESSREQLGARSLEIVPPKNGKVLTQGPRLEVGPEMAYADMLQAYVTSGVHPHDSLDTNYLVQLGLEILDEVGHE